MKKYIAISLFLIFLDQLTKYWAQNISEDLILNSWLKIQYSQNYGIAFGIPLPQPVIFIAAIILLPLIYKITVQELDLRQKIAMTSLILIFSGAIANIIDRLRQGFVTDFIAIGPWPNFNLADSYIVVGVLLIMLFYSKISRNQQSPT